MLQNENANSTPLPLILRQISQIIQISFLR